MIRFGWMTVIVAGLMVAAVSLGVTLTWFERPGYFEAIIFCWPGHADHVWVHQPKSA